MGARNSHILILGPETLIALSITAPLDESKYSISFDIAYQY